MTSGGSTSNGIPLGGIYPDYAPGSEDFNNEQEAISWIADDGTGGGSSGGPVEEEEDEEKIDDSGLEGKEKCLNNLLDKEGDSFVQKLLANFKGDGSEFDIKIKTVAEIVREGEQKSGLTSYQVGSSKIEIDISASMANSRPALAVARTILHEYCHADMYRKLYTKYETEEELDFRKTYEAFEEGNFEASPQHESMAELYISKMSSALKEFHKNALTGDYNYLTNNGQNPLPDSFYEGLAWRGLKNTGVAAYKSLSPAKKDDYRDAVEKYYFSTTSKCPDQ